MKYIYIIAISVVFMSCSWVDESRISRVKVGMTQKEVFDELGSKPFKTRYSTNETKSIYRIGSAFNGDHLYINYENGKVTKYYSR